MKSSTLVPLLCSFALIAGCSPTSTDPSNGSSGNISSAAMHSLPNSSTSSYGTAEGEPSSDIRVMQEFNISEVSNHSSKTSCWTVIDGSVYDITSYIPFHKGGERDIMKVCGIDGSALFGRKHGLNTEAKNTLEQFFIGELAQ